MSLLSPKIRERDDNINESESLTKKDNTEESIEVEIHGDPSTARQRRPRRWYHNNNNNNNNSQQQQQQRHPKGAEVHDLGLFVKEYPKMRVTYGYTAQGPGELSLYPGERIVVISKPDPDWWEGVKDNGEQGLFPVNRCVLKGLLLRGNSNNNNNNNNKEEEGGDEDEDGGGNPLGACTRRIATHRFFVLIAYSLALGILTGCVSNAIDRASGADGLQRLHTLPFGRGLNHWPERVAYWVLYTCVLASLAHLVVRAICPCAAGSGIPEVKVMLGGTPMPQYMTFRCLVSKAIGLSAAIGSGMFVGKQSAMVHIGFMIAAAILRIPAFRGVAATPGVTTQLLIAGASCGFAAHFGTPIAGILFGIEVTPTYYVTGNYWSSILASVVSGYTSRFLANCGDPSKRAIDPIFSNIIPEIPSSAAHWQTALAAVVTGIFGALLGIAFINFTVLFYRARIRYAKNPFHRYPAVAVLAVAFLTGLATSPDVLGKFISEDTNPTIRELFTSSFSDWGIFGSPVPALFVMLAVRFVLTAFSIPLATSIALYAIGSVFGRIVGELFAAIDGWEIDPGSVAMIGTAAYVGAVTHTFSSAVVILEMTGDLKYCFHSLLATAISLTVSRRLSNNVFERIISVRGLPFLFDLRHVDEPVCATNIMSTDFMTITKTFSYKELRRVAKELQRRCIPISFLPVVDHRYYFIGTVSSAEVLRLYKKLKKAYKVMDGPLERKSFKKKIFQIRYDDVPFICLTTTPLQEIHRAFITLSLQYITVTKEGKVVGTLTHASLSPFLKN